VAATGGSRDRPDGPVKTSVALGNLRDWLDAYLRVTEIPDEANAINGLQVENSGAVTSVIAAVDAAQATIAGAIERAHGQPVLLLVHHGLFWDGNAPLAGQRYRRVKALLDHDVAVYSAHIPLDIHPEVGNNAVLARLLGLEDAAAFDTYRGIPFGVAGRLALPRDRLVERLHQVLGVQPRLVAGGPERTARVGIITGAAGGRVRAAFSAGCDTFITGEAAHHTYFDAMELGVNLVLAGHYATEQVGVKALAERLAVEFGLPWEFHPHPTGL
jgi:dinuclear metal center YbgI/SA1388 family protein